tara:strand:- start:169 stop:1110 length:942 start_codon:yes stop_codon:yes gene_type:complete
MNIKKPNFWDRKIGFLSIILLPFSLIFFIVNQIKKKIIKGKKFNIPIICIGNIYVGGTGKTPASIFLGKELKKLGHKPVILRKYYKNHLDEYNLIKNHFKDLILSINRIDGIEKLKNLSFDTIILDDGFQDHSIKKDINIICFNQNQLIGNGMIIPSGPLREGLNSLKKANIILINGKKNSEFENKILKINSELEIFYSAYKPINLNEFKKKKLLAVAGIGNPENFFQLIEENELRIEKKIVFPDHFQISKNQFQNIIKEAKYKNYEIIMTEKDYFKIRKYKFKNVNYLKVMLKIFEQERFIKKINEIYNENY